MEKDLLLDSLNKEQKEAVVARGRPLLIMAGAGSGKTKVLTHKIAWLIRQGVPAHQILAVTFTNKAANEMKERVASLVDLPFERGPEISTFHSFGLRFLLRHRDWLADHGYGANCSVIDPSDQLQLIKGLIKEKGCDFTDDPKVMLSKVLLLKEMSSLFDDPSSSDSQQAYVEKLGGVRPYNATVPLFQAYRQTMKQQGLFDFDDLLLIPLRMLRREKTILEAEQKRYQWILVDEYQDVNLVQTELLRFLVGSSPNLAVVGDPDQLIYSWRGACMSSIMGFTDQYNGAQVVLLEQNYRCHQKILDLANDLIRHNDNRPPKDLWTQRKDGAKPKIVELDDSEAEANYVARTIEDLHDQGYRYSDMAVLYRSNAQSRALELALGKAQVPYRVIRGTGFFDRREIKDYVSFLRLAVNPYDSLSLERVANVPARGLGPKAREQIRSWLEQHAGLSAEAVWFQLAENPMEFKGAAAEGLRFLATTMSEILEHQTDLARVEQLVLEQLGYEREIKAYDKEGASERRLNIMELRSILSASVNDEQRERRLSPLAEILAQAVLFTDFNVQQQSDTVNLSTLHGVKGLEFPVVFITGMEDRVFPSGRSEQDSEQLEEERRLCYVGMTRAEEQLIMTYGNTRLLYGQFMTTGKGKFVTEMNPDMAEWQNLRRFKKSFYGAKRW